MQQQKKKIPDDVVFWFTLNIWNSNNLYFSGTHSKSEFYGLLNLLKIIMHNF